MNKEQQISLLVAAAAVVTALIVAWYYISPFFIHEEEIACGAEASRIEQLNVRSPSGHLMTPIELQTEIGRRARGIVKNARVVNAGDAPPKVAIEITLPQDSTSPYYDHPAIGGIGFEWSPGVLKGANSLCLRYALKLPDEFKPAFGGVLPGFFGGSLPPLEEVSEGTSNFAIHTVWRADGRLQLYAQIPTSPTSNPAIMSRKKFEIPRGRWVWVDQRITLNTPGNSDGAFKLWFDNKVIVDNPQVMWRQNDNIGLDGISGAIYYGTPKRPSLAPEATVIGMSPFQLSWQ